MVDVTQCRKCPRLVEWREEVAISKRASFRDETYWGRPVPSLGRWDARLMVVGLAPAAHGANRTGRMFTGDRSGDWLIRSMYRAGFASQPESVDVSDGLGMNDAVITAIVRCAPPDNKPTVIERDTCRQWLDLEFDLAVNATVIVALGGMAFDQVLRVARSRDWAVPRPKPKFAHGVEVDLGLATPLLIGSYHPSQQNTFTGRLTEAMLDDVFNRAAGHITSGG